MKKLILLSLLALNTVVFANTTLPSTTEIPWKSSKIYDYVTVDDSNNIPVAVTIYVDPSSVLAMVGCNGKSYNINPGNSFSCVTSQTVSWCSVYPQVAAFGTYSFDIGSCKNG